MNHSHHRNSFLYSYFPLSLVPSSKNTVCLFQGSSKHRSSHGTNILLELLDLGRWGQPIRSMLYQNFGNQLTTWIAEHPWRPKVSTTSLRKTEIALRANVAARAFTLGIAVAQWLRCCATNRKVAGSISLLSAVEQCGRVWWSVVKGIVSEFQWAVRAEGKVRLCSLQLQWREVNKCKWEKGTKP